MNYRVLLLCFLLTILTLFAQAQRAVFGTSDQMGGGATVMGVVGSFNGAPLAGVQVELQQLPTFQVVASGYTLSNGSFEFLNVPLGQYEVVATEGLQQTRQRLQVHGMNPEDVHIRLAAQAADGPQGGSTVSVAQLKIPDKARGEYKKAEKAMQKQKFDDVRRHLAKALEIAPKYSAALTLEGILDLGDNQFDQARLHCEQAIQSDGNYGMAYVVLGAAYNSLARFDDAIRALEHGLTLLPRSWQGHFEIAKALLGKSRYQDALRQIDQAAELVPAKYPAVHLIRAHALLGLKNYSEAITELEQYLGGAPNSLDAASARETLDQARAFAANRKTR